MKLPVRLIFVAILLAAASPGMAGDALSAAPSPFVYVSSGVWSSVYEVEIATGDRRLIDLDDWPRIIKATDFAVEREGTLLIETVDALQRRGIYRVDPAGPTKSPVSGGVDGFAPELLGDGPAFDPSLNTLLRTEDALLALRDFGEPMEVALASGDRRLIYGDDATTPPLTRPDDMVLLTSGTLLLADRFEGLWQVDIATGQMQRQFAPGYGGFTPRRMDRLPDGRIVFLIQDPDADVLWALNLKTGEQTVFSGTFGGTSRGGGPDFDFAYDVMVDGAGRIFVLDAFALALIEVSLDGDRTVISSPDVGEGWEFFPVEDRPTLGTWQQPIQTKGHHGWLIY